jgi:hypothetical protein
MILLSFGINIGTGLGYHDAQSHRNTAQYPSDTDKRIERCFTDSDTTRAQECVEDAVTTSHENQRSEYDLQAQRDMAQWAFWLLIVTSAQFPLTVAGLLALVVTIRQGQDGLTEAGKANRISREEMEASHRPILEVEPFGPLARDDQLISLGEGKKRTIQLRVGATVRNVGNGDAEIIRFCIGGFDQRQPACIEPRKRLRKDEKMYLADPDKVLGYESRVDSYDQMETAFSLAKSESDHGKEAAIWYIQHIYSSMAIVDTGPILIRKPPPFAIEILYRDNLGIERIAGFGFEPTHMLGNGFRRVGGDKLNYDRKVEE